jgi:virginiamycin A acetyltransferase
MLGPSPHNPYPMPLDPKMCYLKNIVQNPNIIVGDYTYYYDFDEPEKFERNVLYHFPFTDDKWWDWDAEKIARNVNVICSGDIDALEKAV